MSRPGAKTLKPTTPLVTILPGLGHGSAIEYNSNMAKRDDDPRLGTTPPKHQDDKQVSTCGGGRGGGGQDGNYRFPVTPWQFLHVLNIACVTEYYLF